MTEPTTPPAPWEARFARELLRRREAEGMSQSELSRRAKAAGLNLWQSGIGKIEAGERSVSFNDALVLASILGVDPLEMVGYTRQDDDPLRAAEASASAAYEVGRRITLEQEVAWHSLLSAISDANHQCERVEKSEPELSGDLDALGDAQRARAARLARVNRTVERLLQLLNGMQALPAVHTVGAARFADED